MRITKRRFVCELSLAASRRVPDAVQRTTTRRRGFALRCARDTRRLGGLFSLVSEIGDSPARRIELVARGLPRISLRCRTSLPSICTQSELPGPGAEIRHFVMAITVGAGAASYYGWL
jgi:hypothetical protein